MLWYSLQCSVPCPGSVKAALENTTWLSLLTSTPHDRHSWAVSDASKNKSLASLSRGKRQLRLLYPWLYTSSRSWRHVIRWRCSAQVCRKFSFWANRSKRTGFLSRKAWLMKRASLMFGVLRSRNGSCMVCCIVWAEPVRENKAYKINCFLEDVEESLIFKNIPCIKNLFAQHWTNACMTSSLNMHTNTPK